VLTGASPSELTDRERALVRWCRAVVRDPGSTGAADVDALRAAGFSDRDVFEVTAIVAFRVAFSTLRLALGVQPDAQLADSAARAVRDAVDFGRPVADVPSATAVDP
jgi:alkylhydroperoxidase family enzyme